VHFAARDGHGGLQALLFCVCVLKFTYVRQKKPLIPAGQTATLHEKRNLPRKPAMSIRFQSVCSSSAGNCLGLWSQTTRLLIDCGLGSMKRTRRAMTALYGDPAGIDAVLLTHTHSDHISYYPLRVLQDYGIRLHLHEACLDQLNNRHFNGTGFRDLRIAPYDSRAFTVGDFRITPFAVPHHPGFPTCGYQIQSQGKKIVIATDFLDWETVFEHFLDADFIFVESNHDMHLLRKYFNPNSRYHMPNPKTAQLLLNVRRHSRKPPRTVMLGHISSQRNNPKIALTQTQHAFRDAGLTMDFQLTSAPLREPGEVAGI